MGQTPPKSLASTPIHLLQEALTELLCGSKRGARLLWWCRNWNPKPGEEPVLHYETVFPDGESYKNKSGCCVCFNLRRNLHSLVLKITGSGNTDLSLDPRYTRSFLAAWSQACPFDPSTPRCPHLYIGGWSQFLPYGDSVSSTGHGQSKGYEIMCYSCD